uniref:7TM GPCR serpentine receptor class x (Srx) domain-containing protein n=2 Tax=Caenorhabditis japonica TaxID=281687 RepID=A0A8R1I9V5_CAEJA
MLNDIFHLSITTFYLAPTIIPNIYVTIRNASQSVNNCVQNNFNKRRSHQELTYAMQFCLISMFYTITWILFRLFPMFFGGQKVEWFILTSLCHVCNCSANALVYIMFNKEIRNRLSTNKLLLYTGMLTIDDTRSVEVPSRVHTISIPSSRI